MSKPCCFVSKPCVCALNWPWPSRIGTLKWRRHTSYCDVMNIYHQSDVFFIQSRPRNFNSKFPVNDLCHDSIGNKLFGFVFSRSDESIVIGVCGIRLADQDHRIVSDPIAIGSFVDSGPGPKRCQVRIVYNLWSYLEHIFDNNMLSVEKLSLMVSLPTTV